MMPVPDTTFGELLRRHRRSAELTQDELAERAAVSVRAISDLEREVKHRPHKDTVQLLADALALAGQEREAFQRAARRLEATALGAESPLRPPPSGAQGPATPPTNLPHEPTPFIGRRHEMAALAKLLLRPDHRLVTLTGPGGSGKTRLALEVASTHLPTFQDGVFLVSLTPLASPELVAPTIAVTLGITVAGGQSPIDALIHSLQGKQLLLVLDNFEHLLDAAPLVGDLLRSCPSLQILVTSRAILRLSMEREFPVLPLSLPPLTLVPDLAALAQSDSVALFVDRARAARPDFVLTHENAPYVAAICHRLDGLPLGLELAAARTRVLPPQALLTRLSHRFDVLTGGARDRPSRQQTLRRAIGWSYSLLSPEEQTLFARLSVFAGGWTLEAAETVCNPDRGLAIEVLDGLASLVEQSLVQQEGEGEPRLGMLETIREYAADKLDERGEVEGMRRRHALYFVAFAEAIRPKLDGPEQGEEFKRLDEEHNNLRAAIDWACDSGDVEMGLRLAIAAESFSERGYLAEVGGWFERLLAAERNCDTAVPPSLRADALQLAAVCEADQGSLERVRALTEESIALIGELSDPREIAYRLRGAGFLLRKLGEYERAIALLTEARSRFMALEDRGGLGVVLVDLADIAREEGDAERIVALCQESVDLCREAGIIAHLAYALHNLGVAARMLGDIDRAHVLCEEALQLYGQTGKVSARAFMLASLGAIVREQGDLDGAESLHAEGLQLYRTGRCDIWTGNLEGMAGVAAARGQVERASVLYGAAAKQRERSGRPVWPVDRPGQESDLAFAREALGIERFARLWEEGRAMTVDQAIAYALDGAR